MKLATYIELCEVIADLARLDKATANSARLCDALEEIPHSDDSIEEATDFLKMLRSTLEDITA